MKNIKFFLIALALVVPCVFSEVNVRCALIGDGGYYDLTGLAASANSEGQKFYSLDGYEFNMCTNVVPSCKDYNGTSFVIKKDGDVCKPVIDNNAEVKIKEDAGMISFFGGGVALWTLTYFKTIRRF